MSDKKIKKKILILTLGTGDILYSKDERDKEKSVEEKITERIANNKFSYREANYLLMAENKIINSQFVAEPLCELFDPDEIYMLGTLNSSWSGFYTKFSSLDRQSKEIVDNAVKLYNIEQDKEGIIVDSNKLPMLNEELAQIYESIEIGGKKRRVIPVFTKYGVDEAQLRENYEIISNIFANLSDEEDYEVAFDITHSFRSLPLYNLIILNYFQKITNKNIVISHIYYGNFEAAKDMPVYLEKENKHFFETDFDDVFLDDSFKTAEEKEKVINDIKGGKVAPILDFKDLIEVLELTNGVNEFKNTGNTITLSNILGDSDEQLSSKIMNFYDATQLNDFSYILKSLISLTDELKNSDERKKYADLRNMIDTVFQKSILMEYNLEDLKKLAEYLNSDDDAHYRMKDSKTQLLVYSHLQYLFADLYRKQNKYGVAIATALEAARSYLTILYFECCSPQNLNFKNLSKEGNRTQAEKKFIDISKKDDINTSTKQMMMDFVEKREIAKKIRNTFAHNLLTKEESDTTDIEEFSSEEAIYGINAFFESLKVVKDRIEHSDKNLRNAYKDSTKKKIKKESLDNVRILITYERDEKKYPNNLFKSNTHSYNVCRVPIELMRERKGIKNHEIISMALKICKFLKTKYDFTDKTQIIFFEMGDIAPYIFKYIFIKEELMIEKSTNFLKNDRNSFKSFSIEDMTFSSNDDINKFSTSDYLKYELEELDAPK